MKLHFWWWYRWKCIQLDHRSVALLRNLLDSNLQTGLKDTARFPTQMWKNEHQLFCQEIQQIILFSMCQEEHWGGGFLHGHDLPHERVSSEKTRFCLQTHALSWGAKSKTNFILIFNIVIIWVACIFWFCYQTTPTGV